MPNKILAYIGDNYNALLFEEVYTFIHNAPENIITQFMGYLDINDNNNAIRLLEEFLNIQVPHKMKDNINDIINDLYKLANEPEVDWGERWEVVEANKNFLPREMPYGLKKNKGYWKYNKHPKIKHTT